MKISESRLAAPRRIKNWVVETWVAAGVVHGFLGADLDFAEGTGSWDELFPELTLCLLKQVHGDEIVMLEDGRYDSVSLPEGDGWILSTELSGRENVLVGIRTADCAPVLLRDRKGLYLAALHCGWRSAVKGILPKCLQQLKDLGVEAVDLEIAIGPCASVANYQIGEEVAEEFENALKKFFLDSSELNEAVVEDRQGEKFGNISGLLRAQAMAHGVPQSQICRSTFCTISSDEFFSFRRQNLLSGRQVTFIGTPSVGKFFQ